MKTHSKFSTIMYIFLLTVIPQIIVVSLVGLFIYWCMEIIKYPSTYEYLFCFASFIAICFMLLFTSVFVKSYGLSVFHRTSTGFNSSDYHTKPITKIEYSYGPKNVFTGERPIYVEKREEKSGCGFYAMCMPAIFVGLTGIFKFLIESLRVSLSENRQNDWEACRADLIYKKNKEGTFSFFKAPIIGGIICCVLAVSTSISVVNLHRMYDLDNLEFDIVEKQNSQLSQQELLTTFIGELRNKGNEKISLVEGTIYFKDIDGNVLFFSEHTIKESVLYGMENLDKEHPWEIIWEITGSPNDASFAELYGMELDEIEISMEVARIKYSAENAIKQGGEVDYLNEILTIKPAQK